MKVAVLGSGSRGNCVAVISRGKTILVDAGFGPRAVPNRAKAAGAPIETVVGILLTHEHSDHTREAAAVARRFDCPIYGSEGTLRAADRRLDGVTRVPIKTHQALAIPPFTVTACNTSHDAAEPLAYSVAGPGSRQRIGIAYDLGCPSAAIKYLLRECQCLIVEANHDEVMLHTGPYPPVLRQRIAGATGHLSNRAAAELLSGLIHKDLAVVVLAHLSQENNDPVLAERVVREAMVNRGYRGKIIVARQSEALPLIDLTELSKTPSA